MDVHHKMKHLEGNYGKSVLPLSAFENVYFPGTKPLEILLFYKKGTSITTLQQHLRETIEQYNLFSSRLIAIDENNFALQYCTDGAVINVLPPLNVRFDDVNIDEIKKMMVHVQTLPGEPLFAVTGIPINDGIFGGISCSHAVGDGIALMLFLYAWSCFIEGRPVLPPSSQRLFQGKPVCFENMDKAWMPPLSLLSDTIQSRVRSNDINSYTKREYFTDEFLHEIKKEAKSENANYMLSDNQIMTAFLLKKYHHQILPDTDRVSLKTPINIRDVHPDVEPLYIGNANFNTFTEFTKNEIGRMSIPQLAYRLKESIAGMRNEKYIKELSYVSPYGMEIKMDVYKRNRPPYDIEQNIVASNLTHLNDLESMGLGSNIGSILHIGLAAPTGFTMLKEKSGRIFAEITSRYPFI